MEKYLAEQDQNRPSLRNPADSITMDSFRDRSMALEKLKQHMSSMIIILYRRLFVTSTVSLSLSLSLQIRRATQIQGYSSSSDCCSPIEHGLGVKWLPATVLSWWHGPNFQQASCQLAEKEGTCFNAVGAEWRCFLQKHRVSTLCLFRRDDETLSLSVELSILVTGWLVVGHHGP